jgi:hypothetical protein
MVPLETQRGQALREIAARGIKNWGAARGSPKQCKDNDNFRKRPDMVPSSLILPSAFPAFSASPASPSKFNICHPHAGASGRFVVVEKSHGFSLVRSRPVIDRQLGYEVMGVVRCGSVSWQLGQQKVWHSKRSKSPMSER